MDKTLMGLIAAVAAMAPMAGAQASVTPEEATRALNVSSVAELLDPVPNSAAVLAALDANPSQAPAADKGVQEAQFFYHHHHHHNWYGNGYGYGHHHHHRYWRRRYYHHHHYHNWN